MGKLLYGNGQEYEFDDRTLSHVKIALVTKLRRHESFLLNWQIPPEQGGGRMSLWISREIPMAFVFAGSRPPALNERWMEALLHSSQRTGGMEIMREDEAEAGHVAD
ncbi:hypothetical protein [Leifsonia aquatica]|uniref:DUF7882 family protein n=1 Tax=Leifsonia aquatica TaxID=144185 RepID=UPI00046868F9|nr:hypothetical protein [Leifsonia aquatica]